MLSEPFYGHYLASLQKLPVTKDDTDVPVLEIRLRGMCDVELLCQPDHWYALTPMQQVGALKHEALHLVLGHIFQRGQYLDKSRFDLAADLVVNQYLAVTQLLPHSVTLDELNQFRKVQGLAALEPLRELAYYYQALEAQASALQPPAASAFTEQQRAQSQHKQWRYFGEQSQSQSELLQQQLAAKLDSTAERCEPCNGIGQLPAAIIAILKQVRQTKNPALNWRRALRLFANSSRRTSIKNTLRRPSKRYGTTPGIKIQPHQRLLIALDTSGSVADAQLQAFFEEVHHIWRAGAEITIVECDTEINHQYLYKGITPSSVTGRGGTCFDEPIKLANQQRFDGTIYFTDGEALAPTILSRKPLLWLIHSGQAQQHFKHIQHSGRVIPMA